LNIGWIELTYLALTTDKFPETTMAVLTPKRSYQKNVWTVFEMFRSGDLLVTSKNTKVMLLVRNSGKFFPTPQPSHRSRWAALNTIGNRNGSGARTFHEKEKLVGVSSIQSVFWYTLVRHFE